ncbi:MAG: hypothetical protein WCV70_02375 [Patescibacteria group bacterium]|jgi:hypothetical protein
MKKNVIFLVAAILVSLQCNILLAWENEEKLLFSVLFTKDHGAYKVYYDAYGVAPGNESEKMQTCDTVKEYGETEYLKRLTIQTNGITDIYLISAINAAEIACQNSIITGKPMIITKIVVRKK